MRILFASAELAPYVKVGGLGDFTAGLVRSLRSQGLEVDVLLPDYGGMPFTLESVYSLDMPGWSVPVELRHGRIDDFAVTLVSAPGLSRPHPYLDSAGVGWDDNDRRFFTFSAAIAAWAEQTNPDVLHLNDWHTSPTLGLLANPTPSLLTIHNLAYQGITDNDWLEVFARRSEAYEWFGATNPLTGGIALADRIVTVSPTFAIESLQPETSFGLAAPLAARGDAFKGILNGIDTDVWDPENDPYMGLTYNEEMVGPKREMRRRLMAELGWDENNEPLIGMVTRLTGQKGVDIALDLVNLLDVIGARMVLLGSGERDLALAANQAAANSERFVFHEGYDEGLSHRIFGGCDLYLMPSRFEPAGLTQMQAMRYGTIPVVTDVGGLHDTVIDADEDPDLGTGFVAAEVSSISMADALHRAVKAWRSTKRRGDIRRRGMSIDWSWAVPAALYVDEYQAISSAR